VARAAVLERLSDRPPIVWRDATVRAVTPESERARTIALDVAGWPGHVAGQHLDVRLTAEDGYQAQRSYSIASAPEDGAPAITVERIDDGEVSPYLTDELRPGDALEIRGPVGGHFTWRAQDGGPLLLVAGGSGLVPLMSILRHRAARGSDVEARVLVSAGRWEDVLYRDELARMAAGGRGVAIHATVTRARPAGLARWDRRVDAAMLAEVGPEPAARPRAFVCGPTPFVERVADLLVDIGHDPRVIRAERFGPTGG
jgi:ferredoxin-NADP reductase